VSLWFLTYIELGSTLPKPLSTFALWESTRHSAKVVPVNSKIRKRGPGPFFFILSVACLIGLIVLVWRSPETVYRISHALIGETKNPAPIATNENQEPSESKAPKKATKAVRNPLKPPPTAELTQADPPQPEEAQVVFADPSNASVKTDSAVAYSFNSQGSPVVYVLKKGDTVETSLELVDSAGRWSLIRMRDSNRSAFVRSENLEHATPLKSSTVK
jgi:hypothetical protein